jgi:hypothetical protein
MNTTPIIAFGQQPCGVFPQRFLVAKIRTARRLQRDVGGEVVFFCHDSDHDPRETRMKLHHRKSGEPALINFDFENKVQRRFSPLFLKRIAAGWRERTARQLPAFVDPHLVDVFKSIDATTAAEFCLEMYRRLGLLDGIRVARSGDPEFRRAACPIDDCYVDVPHEGEIVRARLMDGRLMLHEGGNSYIELPACAFTKEQVSPTRDSRLKWMQSVLHCTHYVSGASEQNYLRKEDAPGITYVNRDPIDRSDEAFTEFPA